MEKDTSFNYPHILNLRNFTVNKYYTSVLVNSAPSCDMVKLLNHIRHFFRAQVTSMLVSYARGLSLAYTSIPAHNHLSPTFISHTHCILYADAACRRPKVQLPNITLDQ